MFGAGYKFLPVLWTLFHITWRLVGDVLVRFVENKEGFLDASIELLKTENRNDDIKY